MYFALLPPEINSGRMYAGPGPAPMLAAAAAWDGLAADLYSTATSYSSVISGLTAGPWLGPSSASMAAAAAPYVAWMHATAAQCEQTGAQAKAAAAAFEAAFAMTVPPPVIAANRALLMALVATNFLGINTPAIMVTEAHYTEMWAQDATAMTGYASASATASRLTPFTPPPQATNAAGFTRQAAAVVQAASTPAGAGTQTVMSAGSQPMALVPQALRGLAVPVSSSSSSSGLSGFLSSLLPSSPLEYLSLLTPYTSAVGSTTLGLKTATMAQASNLMSGPTEVSAQGFAPATGAGGQASGWAGASGSTGSSGVGPSGGSTPVTAGLGRAAPIGALTVPPSWTASVPTVRLMAATSPATSASAAPTVASDSPLTDMAAASMAGQAMAATARRSRPSATPTTVMLRHPSAG